MPWHAQYTPAFSGKINFSRKTAYTLFRPMAVPLLHLFEI